MRRASHHGGIRRLVHEEAGSHRHGPDTGGVRGHVGQMVRDQVDDVAFTLDAPLHRDHARSQDNAALTLTEPWPDNDVSHAALVFDRYEHDALS